MSLKNIPDKSKPQYLLALHSCTETFGVGVLNLRDPHKRKQSQVFTIGRKLSNEIFICIEKLLPIDQWRNIVRIAVATGPGSFTGTRLSIAMARTIAQQLECSLDAISSFQLMASRIRQNIDRDFYYEPFWIKNNLNRRGIVAGQYQIKRNPDRLHINEVIELQSPQLVNESKVLYPSFDALEDVQKDIIRLLEISYEAQKNGIKNDWNKALPIYPTSPISQKKTINN